MGANANEQRLRRIYNEFTNPTDFTSRKRWYAVPPYKKGENWKILNEQGEIVAWFEMREDCLKVVDTMNKSDLL